jgi:recombination protein RecT
MADDQRNEGQATADDKAKAGKEIKARPPAKLLEDFLGSEGVQRRLAEVCTASLKPKELIRLGLLATSRQPDLLKCTQASILRALMDAAQLGIAPLGIQGRGYLVPRKNKYTKELEAAFDPGWRGLCDIARRGGLVKRIDAKVVYEADDWDYFEDENGPHLLHRPRFATSEEEEQDPEILGSIIAAYARATSPDGTAQIEVLRRSDIDRIRATSMATSEGTPWDRWFDEMSRKSAVKRICKYLPYSPDMDYAVRVADRADGVQDETRAEVSAAKSEQASATIRSLPPRSRNAREWMADTQPPRDTADAQARAQREDAPARQAVQREERPARQRSARDDEPPFGEDDPDPGPSRDAEREERKPDPKAETKTAAKPAVAPVPPIGGAGADWGDMFAKLKEDGETAWKNGHATSKAAVAQYVAQFIADAPLFVGVDAKKWWDEMTNGVPLPAPAPKPAMR